jgi:hypothetical protein
MSLRKDKEQLLQYYQTVRQAIQGFDTLINNILTTGATLTIAILVGPFAIFKSKQDIEWSIAALISIFAILGALYILTAVALYADLLKRAVSVATELEKEMFEGHEEAWLTTELEKNPLAGGKLGTPLYLFMAVILYLIVASVSIYYIWKLWDLIWLCLVWTLLLLAVLGTYVCFLHRRGAMKITQYHV